MDGQCPKCNKIYGDGEASLSADLKPACPICLVDLLVFESSEEISQDESSTQDDDSNDWELAASRWAEGGFKSSEMPSFIKKEAGSETDTDAQESNTLTKESLESVKKKDSATSDIDSQDTSTREIEYYDSISRDNTQDDQRKPEEIKTDLKSGDDSRFVKAKQDAEESGKGRKSVYSKKLAVGLFLFFLAIIALFWYLEGDDQIEKKSFSIEGLKVKLVEAPQPAEYAAKSEALLHYGQGNRYAYMRKWKQAVLEYKESLRLDPRYPHPYRALGAAYAAMGKEKKSVRAYEAYLDIASGNRDAEQVQSIIDSYP